MPEIPVTPRPFPGGVGVSQWMGSGNETSGGLGDLLDRNCLYQVLVHCLEIVSFSRMMPMM